MRSSRPGFSKGAPRSRAFRIQRDLRAHPRARTYPYDTPRQVLNSILALLQKASTSVDQRLSELFDHLKSMPPWTKWSPHTDAVVSSTFQGLHKEAEIQMTTDDAKEMYDKARAETEALIADELIRLNGNRTYLDHNIFKESDPNEELAATFFQWLLHVEATEDPECHVQNEDGHWLNNQQLRDILRRGGRLHITTRTVIDAPRTPRK